MLSPYGQDPQEAPGAEARAHEDAQCATSEAILDWVATQCGLARKEPPPPVDASGNEAWGMGHDEPDHQSNP